MLVLMLLLLYLTVCSSASNNNFKIRYRKDERTCNRGTITPREPYFLEGEDIILNCSRRKGSWRRLTFVRGSSSEEVPLEYITRLNHTAIQLRIPNITKEDVDKTQVSTSYRCVNKQNMEKCYDSVYVRLEYYVHDPVNLVCRDYNFEHMNCSWSLGVPKYHHPDAVNVTCAYKNETTSDLQFNSEGVWELCPELTDTSCRWEKKDYFAPASNFNIKVTVKNPRRNETKEIKATFGKYDIAEPAPVTIVNHSLSSRCIELKWGPPKQVYSFSYVVTYESPCSQEKSTETYNTSVTICNLVPNTWYNISIRARFVTKDPKHDIYTQRGYWSKPTEHRAFTDKDVLDVNPETLPGLYEIFRPLKPLAAGHTTVNLFWTPLPECDLHDSADSVTYRVTSYNVTTTVKHPAFMTQIDVLESKIVNVTVQASNSVGHVDSARIVTVYPEMFGPSPSELVIEYNRTNEDCVTTSEIIVQENGSQFSNITHTLVWCKSMQSICQEPLNTQQLQENISSFVLPGNLCDADYRYGLVTHGYYKSQGQIVETGIHWETCIYQVGKVPDQPLRNVHHSLLDDRIFVEWSDYDCHMINSYITHYQIVHCLQKGKETCSCDDTLKRQVNVSRLYNNFTIDGYEAGSRICVWVRSVSKAGLGPAYEKQLQIPDKPIDMVWIIIISIGIPVVVVVLMRVLRAEYKKVMSNRNITVPEESQSDSATKLLTAPVSEEWIYKNNSAGTESKCGQVSLTEQPFLRPRQGDSDNDESLNDLDSTDSLVLDGYNKANDFCTEESGLGNEINTPDTHVFESQKSFEKQYSESDNLFQKINGSNIADERTVQSSPGEKIELKTIEHQTSNHSLLISEDNVKESSNDKEISSSLVFEQNCARERIEPESLPAPCDSKSSLSEMEEEGEVNFESFVNDLSNKSYKFNGYKCVSDSSFYDSDELDVSAVESEQSSTVPAIVSHSDANVHGDVPVDATDESGLLGQSVGTQVQGNKSKCTSDISGASNSEAEIDQSCIMESICSDTEDMINGYKESEDILSVSESSGNINSDSISSNGDNKSEDCAVSSDMEGTVENKTSSEDRIGSSKTIKRRISHSGGSSIGSSGTSNEVPSYIYKTSPNMFEGTNRADKSAVGTKSETQSPRKKNINGVIHRQ